MGLEACSYRPYTSACARVSVRRSEVQQGRHWPRVHTWQGLQKGLDTPSWRSREGQDALQLLLHSLPGQRLPPRMGRFRLPSRQTFAGTPGPRGPMFGDSEPLPASQSPAGACFLFIFLFLGSGPHSFHLQLALSPSFPEDQIWGPNDRLRRRC